jgi:hypothetical protein
MGLSNMVYTSIYRYIPVYTKMQDLIHGMKRYERFYIHPCGSQCDVDFQGLSMHAYIPMKDTSCTADKSEKKHSVDYGSVKHGIYQYIPLHTSMYHHNPFFIQIRL